MSDDDLIRRVAAAMWKAEAVDAGTSQSVADGRTPKAFEEQSDFIRARWTKFARAAIAAIPAAPTFTAADLERAWEMGRDMSADACGDYPRPYPEYHERIHYENQIVYSQDRIRALNPPSDLAQRVKE